MKRNIIIFEGNELAIDADKIEVLDVHQDVETLQWSVRIYSPGVLNGYILYCPDEATAKNLYDYILARMKGEEWACEV